MFWDLKCPLCMLSQRECEGGSPLPGCGVSPKNLFLSFARRRMIFNKIVWYKSLELAWMSSYYGLVFYTRLKS